MASDKLDHLRESLPNVVGYSGQLMPRIRAGQEVPGTCCVRVYLSKKVPRDQLTPDELVPATIEGTETDCVVIGEVSIASLLPMLSPPTLYTGRWATLISGISIAHGTVTAGSLGCFVVKDGQDYMLTNWHVAVGAQGKQGDVIYQPGPLDIRNVYGEEPSEKYAAGTLAYFGSPVLGFSDSALVRPTRDYDPDHFVSPVAVSAQPARLSGLKSPAVGMRVLKEGRTTGLTRGTVTDVDATLDVSYGSVGKLTFPHLVVVQGDGGNYLAGGDSGSVTREDAGEPEKQAAVGLNFAGSVAGYGISFHMSQVARELGFEFSDGGDPMQYAPSNIVEVTITVLPPPTAKPTVLTFRTDKTSYVQGEQALLEGRLVDGTGAPVAGAEVQIAFGAVQPLRATTMADGTFRLTLSGLAIGTHTLRAQFLGS